MFLFQAFDTLNKPSKIAPLPQEIVNYRALVENKAGSIIREKIPGTAVSFDWSGYGKVKITIPKYQAAFSSWNAPGEIGEKFIPREVNGALKKQHPSDYKELKIWSLGHEANKDGSITFTYEIPEKMCNPTQRPPEKGFWEKLFGK